ncbi:hypothetical protein BD779DRAFT_1529459 [Infundibulicybe gibba]|nr:hypothetical protein BD779DRAFT_1529459 [Infundibulicybe gibba]
MPFFATASGFTINGGEMNDVAGNLNKNQTTNSTTNTNSYNDEAHTTKGSYNTSSQDTANNSSSHSSNHWKNKSYSMMLHVPPGLFSRFAK